ncbi:MAG TPA: hypothetical protein VLJ68_10125 [Chitinophagaceae bacterium]|nr:hypothetical protein [Chitinophagaceae bacterium]
MKIEQPEAIALAAQSLELELKGIDHAAWKEMLAARISDLINHDFQKLVNTLYRIDVDEIKLKKWLEENPDEPAGQVIATLMIERQIEKIKTREQIKKKDGPIAGEEAW